VYTKEQVFCTFSSPYFGGKKPFITTETGEQLYEAGDPLSTFS
jgi:hypothetical protein